MRGFIMFFVAVLVFHTAAISQTRQILFVCEHGSAKSVVAAAYFNRLAKENNLNWVAVTRGTDPEGKISKNAEEGLRKDGLLDPGVIPQRVTQQDANGASKVIVFCPFPSDITVTPGPEHWNNLPAISDDYGKARDAIASKVRLLIDSLAHK